MDMISGLRYQAEKLRKEQEAKAKAEAAGAPVDGEAEETEATDPAGDAATAADESPQE